MRKQVSVNARLCVGILTLSIISVILNTHSTLNLMEDLNPLRTELDVFKKQVEEVCQVLMSPKTALSLAELAEWRVYR